MYTIEKHLENLSVESSQFELLNSIWKLNKKTLPNAQNAISFNFPHYSLHERSHSETIIKNIESFLGEERIKQLSPTDAWLVLMAAFTHDLGMVVFHSVLEKDWLEDDFQSYLIKMSESQVDKDIQEAASLLLKIQKTKDAKIDNSLILPLKIRKAVILITADFYRRNHHFRSKELIRNTDDEFNKVVNGFNLNGVPSRFANVLSEIAYAHGIDFYKIFDKLEYMSDGIGSDKMHPRFIAALLRLGDLLDVDDNRFNIANSKAFSDGFPHISQLHLEKHAAVRHLLISPNSIEVTVDCKSDEVYRVAREWFDWLQVEVQNQSKEWAGIAPKNMIGLPPTISRGKIRILYQSAEPKEGLMDLRFTISNQKVFEMFEGSAIYENAEFVFIREIVQNAIDASKIQLWKQILSGHYDYALRRHHGQGELSHDALISLVRFPTDLPTEIWQVFQINLTINWLNSERSVLRIVVQDNGTGISEKDLIRMTQKVGESRSGDMEFLKFKNSMPYWLKPTGAFGIGLQSLFLITSNFIVQTKPEGEDAKEIIFFSSKNGEYSRISNNVPQMTRGTKIIIDIPKIKFEEIFSTSFDTELIRNYDNFSDRYGDLYIHKIEAYTRQEFQYISLLNISLMENEIKRSPLKNDEDIFDKKNSSNIRQEDMLVYVTPETDLITYVIFENLKIGSTLIITFYNHLFSNKRDLYAREKRKYLVRGIPIDEKFPLFFKTSYLNIIWNFESPESDKILNISRDKFIKKTKNKFNNIFLDTVLPAALERISTLFESEFEAKAINESIASQYFHFELTAIMCKVNVNHSKHIYHNFTLPLDMATNLNLEQLSPQDFFSAKRILLYSKTHYHHKQFRLEELKEQFSNLNKSESFNADIVVWEANYLSSYLKLSDYRLAHQLSYSSDTGLVHLYILEKIHGFLQVKTNDLSRKLILNNIKEIHSFENRRHLIPPISPYAEILTVSGHLDGFLPEISYLDYYMISPFKNQQEIKDLYNTLKEHIVRTRKDIITDIIRTTYIDKLVPQKMVDHIILNSVSSSKSKVSEALIHENYISLIVETLLVNFSDDEALNSYLSSKSISVLNL